MLANRSLERTRDALGLASDVYHDYEVWLEKLAPHAPSDQVGPEAGCTTAPAKLAYGKPLSRTGRTADAHLKRQIMGREVVIAVTNGRLDFGTWERIFQGQAEGLARES